MPESGAAAMLDAAIEATRCHDVWPLLEAWAAAEREQEAANEAFAASWNLDPHQSQSTIDAKYGERMRAARIAHDSAVGALLGAVPEPGGEQP